MFNFSLKSSSIAVLPIQFDIHSHVLPGLDDGSPDIETSLILIRGLQQLGINRIVATPHIIGDLYRNTPATIHTALEITKKACRDAQIDIELTAAAEYMLDSYFLDLLKKPERLLTVYDNVILTEQSYAAATSKIDIVAFEIITNGYIPILAHPERYGYYHKNYKNYHYLKELGFRLQVNLLSLTGYYGPGVARAAAYILTNKLASFVGTDIHHAKHLAAFQNKKNLNLFDKFVSQYAFNNF